MLFFVSIFLAKKELHREAWVDSCCSRISGSSGQQAQNLRVMFDIFSLKACGLILLDNFMDCRFIWAIV